MSTAVPRLQPPRSSAHALLAGARCVLIVEDNPWLGSIVAEALIGEHYKVLQTARPRVAVRLAQAYRPDAIVLDLELPDGAGAELLLRLKSLARSAAIPILALSSQAERTSPEVRGAAHAVLGKPFGLPELLLELGEAVALPPRTSHTAA